MYPYTLLYVERSVGRLVYILLNGRSSFLSILSIIRWVITNFPSPSLPCFDLVFVSGWCFVFQVDCCWIMVIWYIVCRSPSTTKVFWLTFVILGTLWETFKVWKKVPLWLAHIRHLFCPSTPGLLSVGRSFLGQVVGTSLGVDLIEFMKGGFSLLRLISVL